MRKAVTIGLVLYLILFAYTDKICSAQNPGKLTVLFKFNDHSLEQVYSHVENRKQEIVHQFDRLVQKHKQKETYLQCALCKCFLFSLRNLESVRTEKNYFQLKNSFCFDPVACVEPKNEVCCLGLNFRTTS